VAQGCHVGEDQAADVVQRPDRDFRRADTGDDHLDFVPHQAGECLAHLRVPDDQVGAEGRDDARRILGARGFESKLDLHQPLIELLKGAAVGDRKGPDHAVDTGRDHEVRA
jgi:hypothetical protein